MPENSRDEIDLDDDGYSGETTSTTTTSKSSNNGQSNTYSHSQYQSSPQQTQQPANAAGQNFGYNNFGYYNPNYNKSMNYNSTMMNNNGVNSNATVGGAATTPALHISNLDWWTTEEDVRGWAVDIDCEDQIKLLAFDEHKINGKSKGAVYIEFMTIESAAILKSHLERKDPKLVNSENVAYAIGYTTPSLQPFKPQQVKTIRQQRGRANYSPSNTPTGGVTSASTTTSGGNMMSNMAAQMAAGYSMMQGGRGYNPMMQFQGFPGFPGFYNQQQGWPQQQGQGQQQQMNYPGGGSGDSDSNPHGTKRSRQ
jgi:hypothetical protein